MEAPGLDILEEEERSRRTAVKEDLAQEKLERQKKLEKEKRKKMLASKK